VLILARGRGHPDESLSESPAHAVRAVCYRATRSRGERPRPPRLVVVAGMPGKRLAAAALAAAPQRHRVQDQQLGTGHACEGHRVRRRHVGTVIRHLRRHAAACAGGRSVNWPAGNAAAGTAVTVMTERGDSPGSAGSCARRRRVLRDRSRRRRRTRRAGHDEFNSVAYCLTGRCSPTPFKAGDDQQPPARGDLTGRRGDPPRRRAPGRHRAYRPSRRRSAGQRRVQLAKARRALKTTGSQRTDASQRVSRSQRHGVPQTHWIMK